MLPDPQRRQQFSHWQLYSGLEFSSHVQSSALLGLYPSGLNNAQRRFVVFSWSRCPTTNSPAELQSVCIFHSQIVSPVFGDTWILQKLNYIHIFYLGTSLIYCFFLLPYKLVSKVWRWMKELQVSFITKRTMLWDGKGLIVMNGSDLNIETVGIYIWVTPDTHNKDAFTGVVSD